MQLMTINELFLSRVLKLNDINSTSVVIKIGKPQNFPDGQDYYCPFQIIGIGDGKVIWAGGIDEIQALLLALEQIGAFLRDSEEYKQGSLSWIGSEEGNLGFPQTSPDH
ncbi:MAG: hypothetical protein H0T84_07625 [Tatlockia sp.]|nr:hypothetical protein [Tatlockia sp.]